MTNLDEPAGVETIKEFAGLSKPEFFSALNEALTLVRMSPPPET